MPPNQTMTVEAKVTNALTTLGGTAPLRVLAFYADGSWEDVTGDVAFESDNATTFIPSSSR